MGVVLARPIFNSGGGGGSPGETLVTSHTLSEDAGNNLSSGFVYTFGQVLKKGQIGSDQVFVLRDHADNSLIPHQIENVAPWLSGEYAHVTLHAWLGVGASASKQIDIYKTAGSYSQSAARTLTDITDQDIEIHFDDYRDGSDSLTGSGAFTFKVNDYINTSARRTKYATGPFCDGWETYGFFTDDTGGASDSQFMAVAMCEALSDNNGALHDVRFAAIFGSPYPLVSSKRAVRGKVSVKANGVLLRDYATVHTFSPSAVDVANNRINIPGHQIPPRSAVRITSSGSMIGGTTSGVMYYCGVYDDDHVVICDNNHNADSDVGNVDFSSQGSGALTITVYVEQPYFSGALTLDRDGDELYILGNKPTVRPTLTSGERQYWQETGIIPPYEAITPSASDSSARTDYWPMSACLYDASINSAGDHEGIGALPNWFGKAWLLQDKQGHKNIKANACVAVHSMRGFVLDGQGSPESAALITCNRGPLKDDTTPYSGMTTPRPTLWHFSNGNKAASISDCPVNVGGTNMEGPFTETTGPDSSHWPSSAGAYIITGRRHHLWALRLSANRHLFSVGNKLQTYNSKEFFIPGLYDQIRGDAWRHREAMLAGFLGPDDGPRQMFRDAAQEVADYVHEMRTVQGADFRDMAWWFLLTTRDGTQAGESNFHRRFLQMVTIWSGVLYRGNANFEELGAHGAQGIRAAVNELIAPVYWASAGYLWRRVSYDDTSDEPSPSQAYTIPQPAYSVATDGTWTPDSTNGETSGSQNGDIVRPWATSKPAELSLTTDYYVVQKSGHTFKLSNTLGGSALTYANPASGVFIGLKPAGPSSGILFPNANDWGSMAMGAAGWAKSAGHSDIDTGLARIIDRIDTAGTVFTDFPKYDFKGTTVIA